MSDESPASPDQGDEAPTTPAVTPDETPTVEQAAGASPDAPAASIADEPPDPAADAVPPDPAVAEATPPAVAEAPADRGRGVFVPVWVAAVVGVLVVAGLGFAIGWIAAPSDDADPSNAVATQPDTDTDTATPGNGNGDGNGSREVPTSPDETPAPPLLDGAYLGVAVEPVEDGSGARITEVADDGPAADSGLEAGDVVTKVDDDDVTSPLELIRAIRQHDPDDRVTITYTRDGTTDTVTVTLGERPTAQSPS